MLSNVNRLEQASFFGEMSTGLFSRIAADNQAYMWNRSQKGICSHKLSIHGAATLEVINFTHGGEILAKLQRWLPTIYTLEQTSDLKVI